MLFSVVGGAFENLSLFTGGSGCQLLFSEKDRLPPKIADQVEGYPEGYDILEEKQDQKAHVSHPVIRNNRARGGYDHSAGCKEHRRCDDPAYGLQIAYDDQCGGNDLGEPMISDPI